MPDVGFPNSSNRKAWANVLQDAKDIDSSLVPFEIEGRRGFVAAVDIWGAGQALKQVGQAVRRKIQNYGGEALKEPFGTLSKAHSSLEQLDELVNGSISIQQAERAADIERARSGADLSSNFGANLANKMRSKFGNLTNKMGSLKNKPFQKLSGARDVESAIEGLAEDLGDLFIGYGGMMLGDEDLAGMRVGITKLTGIDDDEMIVEALSYLVASQLDAMKTLEDAIGSEGAVVDESAVCTATKYSAVKRYDPQQGYLASVRVAGTAGSTVKVLLQCLVDDADDWDDTDASTGWTTVTGDIQIVTQIGTDGAVVIPLGIRGAQVAVWCEVTNVTVAWDVYPSLKAALRRKVDRFGMPMPSIQNLDLRQRGYRWNPKPGMDLGGIRISRGVVAGA